MNRRMKILTGHTYHIYNRGNRKETVFHDRQDYLHFLRQLREYLLEYPVILATPSKRNSALRRKSGSFQIIGM